MPFFRALGFGSGSFGSNFGGGSRFGKFSNHGQSNACSTEKVEKLAEKYQEIADRYADKADSIRDKLAEKADDIRDKTAHKVQALQEKGFHHLAAKVEKIGELKAAKIEKLGECKADIYDAKANHWQAKADALAGKTDDDDVDEEDDDDDGDDDDSGDTSGEDTVDEVKIFYSTVDADGNEQQFTEEGYFQWATVELPEGTTLDEVNIDDILTDVLADLEENGTEVGEVYQVTIVGTDADGNEVVTDYELGTDDDGNTTLVPRDDDTMSSLSTGEASEDDIPDEDDEDDEDDSDH